MSESSDRSIGARLLQESGLEPDPADVVTLIDDARTATDRLAPTPSPELAALMAGSRPSGQHGRSRAATVAVVAALGIGLPVGAAAALAPEKFGEVVDSVLDIVRDDDPGDGDPAPPVPEDRRTPDERRERGSDGKRDGKRSGEAPPRGTQQTPGDPGVVPTPPEEDSTPAVPTPQVPTPDVPAPSPTLPSLPTPPTPALPEQTDAPLDVPG